MCSVQTLKEMMKEYPLAPQDREFCQALLLHGEVLAVMVSYLPDSLLWLVSTSEQVRLLRRWQPDALVMSLKEVADLVTVMGDPHPTSVWDAAFMFGAAAPIEPTRSEDTGDVLP
jgi:hypothetical protein